MGLNPRRNAAWNAGSPNKQAKHTDLVLSWRLMWDLKWWPHSHRCCGSFASFHVFQAARALLAFARSSRVFTPRSYCIRLRRFGFGSSRLSIAGRSQCFFRAPNVLMTAWSKSRCSRDAYMDMAVGGYGLFLGPRGRLSGQVALFFPRVRGSGAKAGDIASHSNVAC